MHDVMCGRNVFDEHMQRVSTDEHSEASIASPTQLLYGALLAFAAFELSQRETLTAHAGMDVACTLLSPRRDRSRTLYIVMVNEGEMVEGVCKNQTQDNDSKRKEWMSASL